MKTVKLTALERRALDFCNSIKTNERGTVNVEWKKSSCYGHCPSAMNWNGEKIAYASGCGYDKLSAVLSDALAFLAPEGERLHCHGYGLSAVVRKLESWGWKLEQTANGKTFDSFSLSRIPAASVAA